MGLSQPRMRGRSGSHLGAQMIAVHGLPHDLAVADLEHRGGADGGGRPATSNSDAWRVVATEGRAGYRLEEWPFRFARGRRKVSGSP